MIMCSTYGKKTKKSKPRPKKVVANFYDRALTEDEVYALYVIN